MQTTSLLKKGIALGVMLLCLTVAVTPDISIVARASLDNSPLKERATHLAQRIRGFPFIRFNSYIILRYDEGYINETTFTPDFAYAIPIQIGYKAVVPHWLLHPPFQALKNWFLYRSIIAPNMVINMSTESTQPWAKIYPAAPNILVDIQNEFVMINSTVVLTLNVTAPPGPFVFTVTAQSLAIHRINGYFITMNIPILVQ